MLRVPRRSPLAEVMQHLTFSADYDAETTASVHAQSEIPRRTVSHCIWVKYVIPTYGTVNMVDIFTKLCLTLGRLYGKPIYPLGQKKRAGDFE